jgi:hypothetical protein
MIKDLASLVAIFTFIAAVMFIASIAARVPMPV